MNRNTSASLSARRSRDRLDLGALFGWDRPYRIFYYPAPNVHDDFSFRPILAKLPRLKRRVYHHWTGDISVEYDRYGHCNDVRAIVHYLLPKRR